MAEGHYYYGKYGKRLSSGQVIQVATDFLVDHEGLHPCIGLDGHRLTQHEAGVNIIRICEEPVRDSSNFIPQRKEDCASCP